MDVKSINVRPLGVHGMHKFFVASLKRLSVNINHWDVIEPVDVTPERYRTGLNDLVNESALNGMNVLNGLGP